MGKKTKVLFIGPYPPPYSGPELSMKQFLESEIINSAFSVYFIQTNVRASNENKGKLGLPMIFGFFTYFFKLLVLLVFSNIKVVYYPVTPTQIGWLGRDALTILVSKLFRKKVIIHLRGSHFKLNFSKFSRFARTLTSFALKLTDKAIVQANYLKDQFAPFITYDKVEVLYQAIDENEFENNQVDNFEDGNILVLGHLTKAKGYTDIVKIIPEIVDNFPNANFYFAGNIRKGERGVFFNQVTGEAIDYEDPFEIENEIKNSKYAKNYHNMTIISGNAKIEAFQKCHIFVSASYSEGFSKSLLEAMSMSKPLVYTPVGAHREVLQNGINGIQVEPGKHEQLVEAILQLLNNKDICKQMGKNNRNEVINKYTLDIIIERFKKIIDKVLC